MGNIAKRVAAIAAGILVLGVIASASGNHQQQVVPPTSTPTSAQTIPVETSKPAQTVTTAPPPTTTPAPAANTSSGLSNTNTYTNSDGNAVHSPAYSTDGSIPEGATAKCSDGTYSFSQHHSGTCSHHGGVATWL